MVCGKLKLGNAPDKSLKKAVYDTLNQKLGQIRAANQQQQQQQRRHQQPQQQQHLLPVQQQQLQARTLNPATSFHSHLASDAELARRLQMEEEQLMFSTHNDAQNHIQSPPSPHLNRNRKQESDFEIASRLAEQERALAAAAEASEVDRERTDKRMANSIWAEEKSQELQSTSCFYHLVSPDVTCALCVRAMRFRAQAGHTPTAGKQKGGEKREKRQEWWEDREVEEEAKEFVRRKASAGACDYGGVSSYMYSKLGGSSSSSSKQSDLYKKEQKKMIAITQSSRQMHMAAGRQQQQEAADVRSHSFDDVRSIHLTGSGPAYLTDDESLRNFRQGCKSVVQSCLERATKRSRHDARTAESSDEHREAASGDISGENKRTRSGASEASSSERSKMLEAAASAAKRRPLWRSSLIDKNRPGGRTNRELAKRGRGKALLLALRKGNKSLDAVKKRYEK
mmetsp:Transcript_4483/g.8168  ORF Transcript_4483/g.8168 Transcript_4483/m.8168 type:complete len:454 (+) Transcript_4483:36-1397(+)